MEILLLTPRVTGVGGIAQHVRKLARKLSIRGFRVDLVSAEYLKTPRLKRLANPSYALCSPLKVFLRDYEIVHGHNLPSLPAVLYSSGKKILTLHGLYSKQIRLLHGKLFGYAANMIERTTLKKLDTITTVSIEAACYYKSLGLRVEHIPNAVDLSDMPKEAERISEPQIIYLGRLSYEKGVDLLLRAAFKYKVRGLVIAGDGPLRRYFEKAHEDKLLTYLGALPRQRALKILAGSDAAVIPSREEGVSTFLLEAMALRVPVIATRVGGNVEIVRDRLDGLLVEPRVEEIVKAIGIVLGGLEDLEKITSNAYRRILEEFNWDIVLDKYLKLYSRILNQ
ncbi:MAG: glycosyltransferase family 4 protein [Nitrososphaeria archaeon]|nr:glycosyltransferase family 4 protein [Nitrososphaeria archaeon]